MQNMFFEPNNAIYLQNFQDGLSAYTQSNCKVTLTEKGYRIYRPPNLTTANDGNTMYGGLKIINSNNINLNHTFDQTDNKFRLQEGHTYIICFNVRGQSSNTFSIFSWTNQMGWSGGGLNPSPTNVELHNIPSDFNGEQECWYKFTISDNISKICTKTYSYAVQGNEYLSYVHFGVGFSYQSTGTLGTDLYINNLRMYDITDLKINITKNGILNTTAFIEKPFKESSPNLCESLVKGGRTTVSNNIITNSGENADTYWYIKPKEALIGGTAYTVSCYLSGFSSNSIYISWGVCAQSGTNYAGSWKCYNGYNEFTFIMPIGLDGSTANIIFDDNGGTRTEVFSISNVELRKKEYNSHNNVHILNKTNEIIGGQIYEY